MENEIIEREEIKFILEQMGASDVLLEMPAVMERIYFCFRNKDKETFKNSIRVGKKGEIYIEKIGKFETKNDGANFVLSNETEESMGRNGIYSIDKYGMDCDFYEEEKEGVHPIHIYRTKDKKIVINDENIFNDEGDAVLNISNYYIGDEKLNPISLGWEVNKIILTVKYPITQEWFYEREPEQEKDVDNIDKEENKYQKYMASQQKEIDRLKKKLEKMTSKYNTEVMTMSEQYKKNIDSIKEKNNELERDNERLTKMLKEALDVCEKIKASPIGNLFFGRKIKRLSEGKELDER